jgi:hypothetical protein
MSVDRSLKRGKGGVEVKSDFEYEGKQTKNSILVQTVS